MATTSIKTHEFGEIDFAVSDNGGYVRAYCRALGWDGIQPTTSGVTLMADAETLPARARLVAPEPQRHQDGARHLIDSPITQPASRGLLACRPQALRHNGRLTCFVSIDRPEHFAPSPPKWRPITAPWRHKPTQIAAGLPDLGDRCPLLVAQDDLSRARAALVDALAVVSGVDWQTARVGPATSAVWRVAARNGDTYNARHDNHETCARAAGRART